MSDKDNSIWTMVSGISGAWCALCGTLAFVYPSPDATNHRASHAVFILSLSVALALVVFAIINRIKAVRGKLTTLSSLSSLEILRCECAGITDAYKRLDYERSEQVRLPLSNSSWPDFGQPWERVHVQLFCLREQLDLVVGLAKSLWEQSKWDKQFVRLFEMKNSCSMYDLLEALQEFLELKPRRSSA